MSFCPRLTHRQEEEEEEEEEAPALAEEDRMINFVTPLQSSHGSN
jgi:hypothetical protein